MPIARDTKDFLIDTSEVLIFGLFVSLFVYIWGSWLITWVNAYPWIAALIGTYFVMSLMFWVRRLNIRNGRLQKAIVEEETKIQTLEARVKEFETSKDQV